MEDPIKNLTRIKEALASLNTQMSLPAPDAPIQITAVSKKHDHGRIIPILQAGHRQFGENRVQEAMAKWPALREAFADIELCLIGPLQSNKVKDAVRFFDVIETVDRSKIARAIATEAEKQGQCPRLLIQVNTGDEPQKSGIAVADVTSFIATCRQELHLPIEGLMCIPPQNQVVAPHFALLKKLADCHGLKVLSMGMSGDYMTAAQLGATHVRIGTGIFGVRQP